MATENLPAGLFFGEARMLTIILKGGVETQSLKTTDVLGQSFIGVKQYVHGNGN